jgi:DNA-binding transcriptional ArsR family regulator
MQSEPDEMVLLKALASTVRQQVLDQLVNGPATSAMLARALESNTGVMSYHLRELAKAGLIEHAVSRGRSRFWRLASGDARFRDPQDSAAPVMARSVIDMRLARLSTSVNDYLQRQDLDQAWRDSALFSQAAVTLTAAELAEFAEAYLALVERSSRDAGARSADTETRAVQLTLFAFPAAVTALDPTGRP